MSSALERDFGPEIPLPAGVDHADVVEMRRLAFEEDTVAPALKRAELWCVLCLVHRPAHPNALHPWTSYLCPGCLDDEGHTS